MEANVNTGSSLGISIFLDRKLAMFCFLAGRVHILYVVSGKATGQGERSH